MEFFRAARGAQTGSTFPETKSSISAVLPEIPLNKGKPDIVIVAKEYHQDRVFLVVETKQRPLTMFGRSYASATRQAWQYAKELNSRFLAVYDGWLAFIFQRTHPYLIGVYNAELEKELTPSFATELFVGLMEHTYRNKSDRLNRLPKPRDPELLKKQILPSVAKSVARQILLDESETKELDEKTVEKRGTELLKSWIENI